jgi:hypothetical protein
MNARTGGTRGPRRAAALTGVTAIAALATACGGGAPAATDASPTYAQQVALAHCMRGHGVPGFPDPGASGGFTLSSSGAKGTVDVDSPQVQAAYGACRHLLSGGGPNLAQLEQIQQREQQAQQQAVAASLKFSRCMRSHGVPNFPDPPASGQAATAPAKGTGIDPRSPRFLAADHACRRVLPAGLNIHLHVSVSRHKP